MSVDKIINDILRAEGGYVNDPKDAGGETNYGITVAVARANGYKGSMKDMPIEFARSVYSKQYIEQPGFGALMSISTPIAEELIDTGVNMGVRVASIFLQRALNALNNNAALYADVVVDGVVGPATAAALRRYLQARGKEGEIVMLRTLNCLQGARYIELSESRPANERFTYGWILNRVVL